MEIVAAIAPVDKCLPMALSLMIVLDVRLIFVSVNKTAMSRVHDRYLQLIYRQNCELIP